MEKYIFKEIVSKLESKTIDTLFNKNEKYSDVLDALHNFKAGASISGMTPAQTCWGYMTKHLVALRDKIERNDFSDEADLLEKCQDSINYIIFIYALGMEENNKRTQTHMMDVEPCSKGE